MLGNYGDDLTNFWGLAGLFGLFLSIAVTVAKGWAKYLFFGLAAVSALLAIFWQSVKVAAPNAAASIVEITNNPQSWFVVFILVVAILIFRPPMFGRALKLSEPSTPSEISADLASLSAEFDAKNNQTWEFSKTIFDGLNRLESQTNAIEKKLYEAVTDRIVPIENTLRPQPSGMAKTLLMAPKDSRFDQIISDIESLRKGIAELNGKLKSDEQYQQSLVLSVADAIRARYTLEEAIESDRTILRLTPRLLSAHKDTYATEAAWLSEYQEWERTMSAIDRIIDGWDRSFGTFLDLDRSHYLEMDGTLPIESAITTAMTNRWQTVSLVDQQYKAKRKKLLEHLDLKSWELPR